MGNPTTAPGKPLPRFDEAEGLGPQDSQFVRDLVNVLEKHGNLDRFGLCLLHEHFPITPDEVLVETHDLAARTLQIRVEKADSTGHAKPSQWRFVNTGHGDGGGAVESYPYQVILQCSPISGCPGSKSAPR